MHIMRSMLPFNMTLSYGRDHSSSSDILKVLFIIHNTFNMDKSVNGPSGTWISVARFCCLLLKSEQKKS